MPTPTPKPQSIEELSRRYEHLNKSKITAEADHKNAENRLNELKALAQSQWGTDDLEELKRKLAEMEAENERKRGEYQGQLDAIEADLKSVEEQFNMAQEKK